MPDSNKAVEVLRALKRAYPGAKYYLNFRKPLDLLIAAILSAQVRDEVVNAATKELFKNFKTAKDYANSSPSQLLKFISKITFASAKAKYIISACKILVEKHKGQVPKDLDSLVKLPGIGKKTAIVILTNAFNIVDGVVVDTHVIRVSNRLGWSKQKNADKRGEDLNKLLPKVWWKKTQWLLKAHGRAICKAVPSCSKCPINKLCPKIGVSRKS